MMIDSKVNDRRADDRREEKTRLANDIGKLLARVWVQSRARAIPVDVSDNAGRDAEPAAGGAGRAGVK